MHHSLHPVIRRDAKMIEEQANRGQTFRLAGLPFVSDELAFYKASSEYV